MAASSAAEAGAGADRHLDFWTFVELALRRLGETAPEADTDAVRVTLTLSRAASVLVYDLESRVHRPQGRSWSAFRVMFVLWLAGPQESWRLAELTGTSRASVSALTKTLERGGQIERVRGAGTPSARLLALTAAGEAEVRQAQREQNARETQWAEALDAGERATLVRLLNKLLDSVEGGPRLRR